MPVGVSFEIPKFGTIGLSIKANVAYRTQFGGEAANIIFEDIIMRNILILSFLMVKLFMVLPTNL